jgi:hypothetical protein
MPMPRLHFLLLAMALAFGPTPALAEPPADLGAYDEALSQAVAAHREQRWLEAHALFERAHQLYPNARTLRGLGISAFEAGQHALALRDLEAALVHAERPLPPDLRQSVEALAAHLRTRVGVYVFRLAPEGAELLIDGEAPLVSPRGEVLLAEGPHRAVVSLAGHVTQTLELDAHGGDRSEMRVLLVTSPPEAAVASGPVQPALGAEPRPSPAAVADRSDRLWPPTRPPRSVGVVGAVGVASFLAAGALYITARMRVSDIGDECRDMPGNVCTETEAAKLEREHGIPRLERAMTATVLTGSAMAVAGAVLWVVDAAQQRRARQKAAATALRFDVRGMALRF